MDAAFRDELRAALLDARAGWERRLGAIRADRRRQSTPLDADFDDQAIQRENDQALDALDVHGREELEAIERALERLRDARFGRCVRCGRPIAEQRLRAQPTAETCLPCAREGAP